MLLLLLIEDYLNSYGNFYHQYDSITSSIENIEYSSYDIYKLKGRFEEFKQTVEYGCLESAIKFAKGFKDLLEIRTEFLPTKDYLEILSTDRTLFDDLAGLMYAIILHSTRTQVDPDDLYWLQYNTVWDGLFKNFDDTKSGKILRRKVRKLLWEKVKSISKIASSDNTRLLGLFMNIFGLERIGDSCMCKEWQAFKRLILFFVKKNYLKLRKENLEAADMCLVGRISFDDQNKRLVCTYSRWIGQEKNERYLDLSEPSDQS